MRRRADRLPKLVNKKTPRPWKESVPPDTVVEESSRPSPEEARNFLLEVRERILQDKISSRPLLNRRARLRRLGMNLGDVYKTE